MKLCDVWSSKIEKLKWQNASNKIVDKIHSVESTFSLMINEKKIV